MTDGSANFLKQFDSFVDAKRIVAAVLIDRHALHVLHHDIGHAIARRVTVEQTRDVGVLERCHDLPLCLEAPH